MCIGIIYDPPEEDVEVLLEDLEKEPSPEEVELEIVNHDIRLVYIHGAC